VKVLLALILIALIVIIVLLWRMARTRSDTGTRPVPGRSTAMKPPADPFADLHAPAGDPRAIKAGDMLEYLGSRYFVRGSLRLAEGGYRWSEHLLDPDAGGTKQWISVEEDPDLEVVFWTELDDTTLRPDAPTLTVNGVEYRRDEHGTASYDAEGTTGLGTQGRVEYVDYEGVGPAGRDRYLSFERFGGGEWEVGVGERIPNGTLTVYPAS
jgi:hypothetical protein